MQGILYIDVYGVPLEASVSFFSIVFASSKAASHSAACGLWISRKGVASLEQQCLLLSGLSYICTDMQDCSRNLQHATFLLHAMYKYQNMNTIKYMYVHIREYILNIQNLSKSIKAVTSIDFVPFDFAPPACSVDAPEAPGKEESEEPFHGVLVVLGGRHKSYHEYHDTLWAISSALCKMRNKRTKEIEENTMVGSVAPTFCVTSRCRRVASSSVRSGLDLAGHFGPSAWDRKGHTRSKVPDIQLTGWNLAEDACSML